MKGVMNLSIVLLLVALLTTMAVVSNPAFAESRLFKNKAECIEGTNVVRNYVLQSAKVSKELAERLFFRFDIQNSL